ncbi:RNA polymerase sigma-70 factor, ECF subfamily [Chitinophaga sp. YR627]|uniref:RNA polymerase sigma-70 factor n=1 Tax=Chitinophaga sp. YR627 TaxID=1881041 RepID=UPI0008F033FF|nr:RNA polymerase sigma-70 factor [Chitinophaga sp. YR627]SFN23140.1 RNA polymerase sigma-70 factor, ECF subfamily [Chitinophaga sp. YR627]
MPPIDESDIRLWNAVRNDDQQAFTRLFDKYWAAVYNTCSRQLKDKDVCQEIVHDIFLSLWTRRQTLVIESFPAFLLTATRYQIYSRRKVKQLVLPGVEELSDSDLTSNEADTRIRQSELNVQLQQLLSLLPPRCQQIFKMSRFEYLSNDEIAEKLHISKRTVENQLTYALQHLRVHLKDIVALVINIMLITRK